jgi:hypothetical protein
MDSRFGSMFIFWWVYGAVGTYVLGTQTGGRAFTWGLVGVLTGPVGMIAALIIPGFQGRIPKTTRTRFITFGFTFGLLVLSEVILKIVGFGSVTAHALWR